MSEYQRYEFMTSDRPLTRTQLDAVNMLSSHIEASSSHALIEYYWGDFKHDPIKVLHDFFDGFLYWANWGAPQLAFRFPHGVLPAQILEGYDLEDFVTFTKRSHYDTLDIHFQEMENDDWAMSYELSPFMGIRNELMDGDLRALYIVWLAGQRMLGSYDEDEEDYEVIAPPVPPAFGKLTAAQHVLARMLQVPQELLDAAAQHSSKATSIPTDDFATWVKLLPPERSYDYLLRLARNEPGLSRLLIKELREQNQDQASATPDGERITYATLLAESKAIQSRKEREERKRQEAARQRHLQDLHEHRDTYWKQVELAAARGSAAGYADAVHQLIELREAANKFQASQEFQERFAAWVQPHMRRYTLIKRLEDNHFSVAKG